MSTISTVGGAVVGAVLTVAGIVTVETRPVPTSAIVICEDYVPAEPRAFSRKRLPTGWAACSRDRCQFG